MQASRFASSEATCEHLIAHIRTGLSLRPHPRTGETTIKVGVLNRGGTDGLVKPEARIRFENWDLSLKKVGQRGHWVVRAHGSQDAEFRVDAASTPKKQIDEWMGRVRNHQGQDFKFWLKSTSGDIHGIGYLPVD